jgi:hypothetical protein
MQPSDPTRSWARATRGLSRMRDQPMFTVQWVVKGREKERMHPAYTRRDVDAV